MKEGDEALREIPLVTTSFFLVLLFLSSFASCLRRSCSTFVHSSENAHARDLGDTI